MADKAALEAVVREMYAARIRGDVDGILRHTDDDVEFSIAGCAASSAIPCAVHGSQALRDVMGRLISAFEFRNGHVIDMLVEGERAVVRSRVEVRVPGSDEAAETELVDLITFRDGKVLSFRQYADTALARRLLASNERAVAQAG
jgi:ketosteroid isomerase-like protein